MKPYVGMPCLYRLRPGQARMGQQEIAAIVTRALPDGRVDLLALPPQTNIADALHIYGVGPATQEITSHCWLPHDDPRDKVIENLIARIEDLETALDNVTTMQKAKPAKTPKPAAA